MRRAFLLGLTLAAAEIVLIADPLLAATLRTIAAIGGIVTLMAATFFFLGRGSWRAHVLPVAIAAAIVAAWTTFRVVVMGDRDVIRVALWIQGCAILLAAMVALMGFLHRRGWITYSSARRRVVYSGLFAAGFILIAGVPAEPWNSRLRFVLTALAIAAIFWPARRPRTGLTSPA